METGLYKKLVKLQKTVRGLAKNAESGSGASGYKYVSGSKVLDVVRPKMDELSLLLVPEVDDIATQRVDYQTRSGAKSEMFTTVRMTFTWIDAETGEKLAVKFGANGQNGWDKGLGSALTYAERYFLLKFFHIATDEDDVDTKPNEDAAPVKPKPRLKEGGKAWRSAVERLARQEPGMLEKLREVYELDEQTEAQLMDDVFNYNLDNRNDNGEMKEE